MMRKWADGYEKSDVVNLRDVLTPPIEKFKRLDKVQISNGSVFIVTGYHPNRPMNCYSGVLENGQGKEYVFGAKHRPVKIGVVTEGHPALLNNKTRKGAAAGPTYDAGTTAMILQLIAAVDRDDVAEAKILGRTLRLVLPAVAG